MDDNGGYNKDIVHLARLALAGNRHDAVLFIRKLANQYEKDIPSLAKSLRKLLSSNPTRAVSTPLRRGSVVESVPVDLDSRLSLARTEFPVEVDKEPVWDSRVRQQLEQIIAERTRTAELNRAGLSPSKSALFIGAPGVGKTLAARWIAKRLSKPLVVLDLAAVMSSFLGRTGNNVRNVLDYAKGVDCVFLLDEFDAVAKRRDDAVEIGELKRLVTVLLQEIDEWPNTGLLLAATNHAELLDPAVWRRFDVVVEFPIPSRTLLEDSIGSDLKNFVHPDWATSLACAFSGLSFAEVSREIQRAKRQAVLNGILPEEALAELIRGRVGNMSRDDRQVLAVELVKAGVSQRVAHQLTGVSRDTIRKKG